MRDFVSCPASLEQANTSRLMLSEGRNGATDGAMRRTRARRLRNDRALLTEASRLFERVRHLQDAKVFFVAAHDLHANGNSFRRETAWHRSRGIARRRDIPAGLHPVDVVIEFHARDLGWIRRVDVKCR